MITETGGRLVRLGYRSTSGRFDLTLDDLRRGVSVVGHGAEDLAELIAFACHDAGLNTLVLDLAGQPAGRLSGYIDCYQLPVFLYDALRLDEEGTVGSVHGQLAAAAYSCALDLSFEQEGIVNSAMQILAAEHGVASPAAVADLMVEKNDKFRGRPADRLVARLSSLSSLNMVGEAGRLGAILKEGGILDFSSAGQPEAVETATALVIAKLLAAAAAGVQAIPDVVVIPQAGRLFRVRPVFRKTERLLSTFVASPIPKVLASESTYGLDEHFEETGFIRIHSSAIWNKRGGEDVLLPNMFMVRDHPYGRDFSFIPREFEPRGSTTEAPDAPQDGGPPQSPERSADLISQMLQDISSYEAPTRQSVLSFLSQGYDPTMVERTLDKLQSEGYVGVVESDLKSGRKMGTLALTEKGKNLLEMSR